MEQILDLNSIIPSIQIKHFFLEFFFGGLKFLIAINSNLSYNFKYFFYILKDPKWLN